MKFLYHKGDLPDGFKPGASVAVDTETMGLSSVRDRLCVVQLSFGDGVAHVVQMNRDYDCPRLKAVLADTTRLKIFHYARFDVMMIQKYLGVTCSPIYCTKIASKLVRTFTDKHGLKELAKEILGVDLNKQQQTSDWGADVLSEDQLKYAASDVLYLHKIKDHLDDMLDREGRTNFARACFGFLPLRAQLDLAGFEETDIFAHS